MPDGNCLFNAVATSHELVRAHRLLAASAVRRRARQLRAQAMDVLCPNGRPSKVIASMRYCRNSAALENTSATQFSKPRGIRPAQLCAVRRYKPIFIGARFSSHRASTCTSVLVGWLLSRSPAIALSLSSPSLPLSLAPLLPLQLYVPAKAKI
eukprot:SAG11_NODE_43_length_20795_cov_11.860456_10_plen_153_part_00